MPELFVPNVFSVATEGKEFRYGSIGMPVELWGPWRDRRRRRDCRPLQQVETAVASMLRPDVVLDLLANFTAFATDKKQAAHQDHLPLPAVRGARTRSSSAWSPASPSKGLIWHFQGSGKSLLMVFAAQKLRLHPALRNPTVLIVVDRIDLDTQITGTFNAADMPEPGQGRHAARSCSSCSRRTRARSSSRRSTSSARPTAC